jgi:hypothetical protein
MRLIAAEKVDAMPWGMSECLFPGEKDVVEEKRRSEEEKKRN